MWMPASEEEILAAIEAGYLIENVGCTGTKRLPFGISLKASNMLNGLQKMGKMCPTHTPHRGGCREQKPPDSLLPRSGAYRQAQDMGVMKRSTNGRVGRWKCGPDP